MRTSKRLTYANVASTLALVMALGGGGAAVAAGLAKNSVGSPQLKAGAVKASDLAKNAVDSSKVKKDALTGADIQESTLVLDLPPGAEALKDEGFDYYDNTGQFTADEVQANELAYTAPTAGQLLLTWSGSFKATQAGHYIDLVLKVDGQKVHGAWLDPGDTDDSYDQSQSVTTLVPVTAGAHTVTVELKEWEVTGGEYSYFTGNDLTAVFIPAS